MSSISRRIRTRLPTYLSMGSGTLVPIAISADPSVLLSRFNSECKRSPRRDRPATNLLSPAQLLTFIKVLAAEAAIIQDSAGCWPDQSSHPLYFWRIKRSAPSGRHYQGGPDFGRGLFLFRHLAGASNQSPSAAQPSHGTPPNPPKSVTCRGHGKVQPRPPRSAHRQTSCALPALRQHPQSHAPTRHCLGAKHHDRERALLQNPEIADAAVLGVPDAVFGETVASARRKAPRMKVAGLVGNVA
jgi:hypothetical protein